MIGIHSLKPGIALCCGALAALAAFPAASDRPPRAVPKAICGPNDHTETGLQGQTTLAERFSSAGARAYSCNLELVGQFEGEGAGFIMQVLENCAYYATWPNPGLQHPGVVVLDIADSRQPRAIAYLDSPTMRDIGEGLAVAPATRLLLGSERSTDAKAVLELYDVSLDCRHPVLKSNGLSGLSLHVGEFAADGSLFYGAKGSPDPKAPVSGVFVLNTSDPTNPRVIATWEPPRENWVTHAISVNPQGTRAYVALLRHQEDAEKSPLVNGLAILDVSDIEAQRPHPQFRLISTLFWDDAHYAQFPLLVTVKGRSYLVFTDFKGALGYKRPAASGECASGKPTDGYARMIDIGDEEHPRTVSRLMLEVHHPEHCSQVRHDPTFGYGSLACDVDNPRNAKLLACGYYEGGLRVFDIRDPRRPREVAYYKPPARRTHVRPASILRPQGAPSKDVTADQVVVPKFIKQGQEIAFISFDNGFQVVRFSDNFRADNKELFRE